MNKNELIKCLKKDLFFKEDIIVKALDSCFEFLSEAILKGFRVEIKGFGSFFMKERVCTTIKNGKYNNIKNKKNVIYFKPSLQFKNLLRNKDEYENK